MEITHRSVPVPSGTRRHQELSQNDLIGVQPIDLLLRRFLRLNLYLFFNRMDDDVEKRYENVNSKIPRQLSNNIEKGNLVVVDDSGVMGRFMLSPADV
ncbi:hypothetical protein EJB05_45081 [Eragrostis curvula]|uniref:Uncharacterized protein n=1 Tax=Eragrostis curvula TaxID=38414 RepID=A0A5J9TJA4_9POAL|nr:hypothetical protein EJB05_45081 [Eragrostis curvula]